MALRIGKHSSQREAPHNNELQRTSDGNAAGSPLNSVFYGLLGLGQPSGLSESKLAVAAGCVATFTGAVAYAGALTARGRSDVPVALVYNLPIAFLFFVSLAYLVVQCVRKGVRDLLRTHAATIGLWTVGFVLLYLRLVARSVEISGHLTWLPMLTAQLWLWRFPGWIVAFGAFSMVLALYLKLAVFQGPSGIPGLVAGLSLATMLVVLSRLREHRAVEQ